MVALTWVDIEKDIRRRLHQTDAKLRQARGEDAAELRGRAQCLVELLNLPESVKAQQEKTDA